jgi:S-DNA-T family DNA segregation ATPase FtsK/SpoIIIE
VHCDECGYDYDELTRAEIAPALRADAAALRRSFERLPDSRLRARPQPDVWSPLEYACHVRDVLEVQRERVLRVQVEDNPVFVPMGRDERAVDRRYNAQDPSVVARELGDAAESLAATLEMLAPGAWARTGVYSYPERSDRSVEWIGRHTVHEIRHHHQDLSRAAT